MGMKTSFLFTARQNERWKAMLHLRSFFALECQQHASRNNELSWNENKIAKQTAITAKHVDTREQQKGRPVRGHEQTHQHKSLVLIFLSSHKSSADLSIFISHYEPTFPSRERATVLVLAWLTSACVRSGWMCWARECAHRRDFSSKVSHRRRLRRRKRKLSPEKGKFLGAFSCPEKCGSGSWGGWGLTWCHVAFLYRQTRHFISHVFLFSKIPSRELHKINVRSGGVRCFCSQKWVAGGRAGELCNQKNSSLDSVLSQFQRFTSQTTPETLFNVCGIYFQSSSLVVVF